MKQASIYNFNQFLTEIAPVINLDPYVISENVFSRENPFHWQQPCCTELVAYNLHKELNVNKCFNAKDKIIDTYLGVPWASFIDKKYYPGEFIAKINQKINVYKDLAKEIGYTLKIHTVCQSIHWKRYLEHFVHIGITDLHSCHYDEVLPKTQNPHNIKIHSWHLYAVNVEDSNRNKNIVIPNDAYARPLLASFKGAHMSHYLSDVRPLLKEAAKRDNLQQDVVVEIQDQWHFNKEVFGRQAANSTKVSSVSCSGINEDVLSYNDLLCKSTFTLCPEGAGINTVRFWETLAVGNIPVLITNKPHIPMLFRLHPKLHECCVVVFRDNIMDLIARLRVISKKTILKKRKMCRKVYQEIKNQTTFKNQYNTIMGIY